MRLTSFFLLLFFLSQFNNALGQKYKQYYNSDFEFALNFFKKHKKEFTICANSINESPEFVFSIVAPEISQYSSLSNLLESNTLKILYVQGGSTYGNFSLGYFQMKPLFVEKMEDKIRVEKRLKAKYAGVLLKSQDIKETRKQRLYHLNSIEWQLKYLGLFCDLMKKKCKYMKFKNNEEKLRYYCTAYNSGMDLAEKNIHKMYNKKFFPHFGELKFNYSDVCLSFYELLVLKTY